MLPMVDLHHQLQTDNSDDRRGEFCSNKTGGQEAIQRMTMMMFSVRNKERFLALF